jgi:predicted cobalt transporter CbtA
MKAVPAWLSYSIYRVLMFAVPLTILLALQITWWVSTVLAAVIGLCLSFLFLRKPRDKVALGLYQARHPSQETVHPDAGAEDASIDRAADESLQRERQSE